MPERRTIRQAGRDKAYRPLPAREREAAVRAALEAWRRGDWFETHELLEPAWMGSDDVAERLRLQAAIKVAAAFVHRARHNRAGVRTNLVGARARLVDAAAAGAEVSALAAAVDRVLEVVEAGAVPLEAIEPPDLPNLLGRGS